jgi:Dolichyl-phosphate-mannose-protein mannosyltransferase
VNRVSHLRVALLSIISRPKLAALGIIILICGLLRLWAFDAPILNHHWLRQVDTAGITRNFATEDMNILYPRVDWRGESSGIVESEFPLYQYTVAALYKIFGEHVELARGLNLLFFFLTSLVMFDFARRMFDENTALLAVLLYGFSPIASVFDHNFQPDSLMMLCSISALNFYRCWCKSGRLTDYALSAVALSIAILIKPLNIYLAAPLFVFTVQRYGWRFPRQWQLWLYGALVLIPAVLWYEHAYQMWVIYGNTLFRAYSDLGYSALWGARREFSIRTYAALLTWRLTYLWAGVGGLALLAHGAVRAVQARNWVLIALISAFATTMVFFADQNLLHDYYQWPLAMVSALLAAYGGMQLWRGDVSGIRITSGILLVFYALAALLGSWQRVPLFNYPNYPQSWVYQAYFVVGALLLLAFAMLPRPPRWLVIASVGVAITFGCWNFVHLTQPVPFAVPRQAFASRLEALTRPKDHIIIAEDVTREGWYQHRTSHGEFLGYMPTDFYLSHRHGWSVSGKYAQPEFIDELRKRGARYFAAFVWGRPIADEFPDLIPYLAHTYTPLAVTGSYIIYRLDKPQLGSVP